MQAGPPLKLVSPECDAPVVRDLGNLGASIVRLARIAAAAHLAQGTDQASRLRELMQAAERTEAHG